MSSKVITVTPQHSHEFCMGLMTEKHLRHLPVLEDDKLIGLVSIGDLVKSIISTQKSLIDQLQSYIRGE
jgi:CBS domain-containing protein